MHLINEFRKVIEQEYYLVFENEDGLSGFRFPCDHKGRVRSLPPLAYENYERCLSNDQTPYIESNETTYQTNALLACDCGQQLYLEKDSNDCPACHRVFTQEGIELLQAV